MSWIASHAFDGLNAQDQLLAHPASCCFQFFWCLLVNQKNAKKKCNKNLQLKNASWMLVKKKTNVVTASRLSWKPDKNKHLVATSLGVSTSSSSPKLNSCSWKPSWVASYMNQRWPCDLVPWNIDLLDLPTKHVFSYNAIWERTYIARKSKKDMETPVNKYGLTYE